MKARNEFITDKEYDEYLLTYFAAKAMQGIMANGTTIDIDKELPFETRAGLSYMIAKAMLKVRAKHL